MADCCVDLSWELTGIFACCLSIEGVDAIGHHESATHEDFIVTMSVDVAALLERLHLCNCYYFFHSSLKLLELNIPIRLKLTVSFQSLKIKQIPIVVIFFKS